MDIFQTDCLARTNNSVNTQLPTPDTILQILMLISTIRISFHTTCAIFCARSDNVYHWFAPLFTAELVNHAHLFIYEFLTYYYPNLLSDAFCNVLVNEYHFISSCMIFLYVWAIFYFLFQEDEHKVHPFAFFIFSFFMVVATAASIIDAVFKEESICKERQFTGFAFAYMFTSAIVVHLTMLVLIGWCACAAHSDNPDKRIYFAVLFTAVVVRVTGLDVFTHHIIRHLTVYHLVAIRAIPLLYPIVFLLIAKGRLTNQYRDLSESAID